MSSASEAGLAGLYICAKEILPLCQALVKIGWPQPLSPIPCDNSTAIVVANETIIPRKTNSMDIKFHCLRCRYAQLVPWVTTTVISTTTLLALVKGDTEYPCQGEGVGGGKRENGDGNGDGNGESGPAGAERGRERRKQRRAQAVRATGA